MAYPNLGSREQLPDFVLYEVSSPMGWSRAEVPVVAALKCGQLVNASGVAVAVDATTAATTIVGISLTSASTIAYEGLTDATSAHAAVTVVTKEGDFKAAVIARDAEVKDTILKGASAEVLAQLTKMGITVVPCGL